MTSKAINGGFLCPDAAADFLTICERMGWCWDEEDGIYFINLPIDDESLFDFICSDLL